MANNRSIVHTRRMAQRDGWFSVTGNGDTTHLTEEQRQIVEDRIRERGDLLGVVQVRVYENCCDPCVMFPDEAVLGVETDRSEIAGRLAIVPHPHLAWRDTPTTFGHRCPLPVWGPRQIRPG
jgi:hypothetical protein